MKLKKILQRCELASIKLNRFSHSWELAQSREEDIKSFKGYVDVKKQELLYRAEILSKFMPFNLHHFLFPKTEKQSSGTFGVSGNSLLLLCVCKRVTGAGGGSFWRRPQKFVR